MHILRDAASCPPERVGAVVTIGAYDGVHLGHRRVLERVRADAAELGVDSAVVTFDRHPAEVVRADSAPLLLCDLDTKLELLGETGVDLACVVTFTRERAEESAEHFVRDVLVDCLSARRVIVGRDFHFGHQRRGNIELLAHLGSRWGFDVVGHDLVRSVESCEDGNEWGEAESREGEDGEGPGGGGDAVISSTRIRAAVSRGEVELAAAMLGRAHRLSGPVQHGDQRGRTIGFPTANIVVGDRFCVPSDGIYSGRLRRAGESHWIPSAIYVGQRPTFYDGNAARVVEVHCLEEPGDLYGQRVDVAFETRLRGDQRFDGVDSLAAQLRLDCAEARRRLGIA